MAYGYRTIVNERGSGARLGSGGVTEPELNQLVELLTLEQLEVNLFRGIRVQTTRQRVFGGQVAGQALVACGRTVPDGSDGEPARHVHSLHAYFLRPGDPSIPIIYTVERTRDGRHFTTRRVIAQQHGKAIFALTASFCVMAKGIEHQSTIPDVPPAESLPTLIERMAPYADELDGHWMRPRPIDLRYVDDPPRAALEKPEPHSAASRVWMRTIEALPDDPLLHVCAITYASDMTLLDSVLLPHKLAFGHSDVALASLDHAMWFHRPFRADEWMLYDQESPSASAGRGFATGRIYRADGALAVSVAQEGLVTLG